MGQADQDRFVTAIGENLCGVDLDPLGRQHRVGPGGQRRSGHNADGLPRFDATLKASAGQLANRKGEETLEVPRTRQDLSLKTVGIGVLLIVAFLGFLPWAFGNVGGVGIRLGLARLR